MHYKMVIIWESDTVLNEDLWTKPYRKWLEKQLKEPVVELIRTEVDKGVRSVSFKFSSVKEAPNARASR